ncbi:MAG: hypothetical protein AAGG68_18340 [Bacteroidota bacterium]
MNNILDHSEKIPIQRYSKKALRISLIALLSFVLFIGLSVASFELPKALSFSLFFLMIILVITYITLTIWGLIASIRAISNREVGNKKYVAFTLSSLLFLYFIVSISASLLGLSWKS